jgi:molecular chaperone DnaK (HSP70)
MNWKLFKTLPKSEKSDESRFMLGIDLGNATSSIAFYDAARSAPELIDISGGYGKPSVPTVMQYIPETREWVFGEYAVLNKGLGRDVTLRYLIEKLGRKEYMEIGSRPVSNVNILGIYLKELIGSVKNINPKAEVAGIVASAPAYLGEDAKEELLRAFKAAGYEKETIGLLSDRECIFSRYYFDHAPRDERVLLLDFGSRELRGGLYEATRQGDGVTLRCRSSLFEEGLGAKKLEDALFALFTDAYCGQFHCQPQQLPNPVKDQIYAFMYQHKDMLFQKRITDKPVKLYYNFAYPPFQQVVTGADLDRILAPAKEAFKTFLTAMLARDIYDPAAASPGDVQTVLCVGGGFEMLWAKEAIGEWFPRAQARFYKNAKGAIAEGAALAAADTLGLAPRPAFVIEDLNQMRFDIGVRVLRERKDRFVPIIERNSFWWQEHPAMLFILNHPAEAPQPQLGLYRRDENGDTALIKAVPLGGLPQRPRGATRIRLHAWMRKYDEVTLRVRDDGFGEFFPKTDYETVEVIQL